MIPIDLLTLLPLSSKLDNDEPYVINMRFPPATPSSPSDILGAQSIGRAAAVLRQVADANEAGLTQLVTRTGLSKPTVRRILLALIEAGLVAQDTSTRHYHLGAETYRLGELSRPRYGVHTVAIDSLYRLAQTSGDSALLMLRQGLGALCLERHETPDSQPPRTIMPGDRHPLPFGAAGIAILSALVDRDVDTIIDANRAALLRTFPQWDIPGSRSHISQARSTGWAVCRGLAFPGSVGLSVPVRGPCGEPIAALSIVGSEDRLDPARDTELGALLVDEARQVEALLVRLAPTT